MVNTKIIVVTLCEAENGEAHTVSKNNIGELTVSQIISSLIQISNLKIVKKTTAPFRYDLNQFTYNDAVEVTNRFKGLDLIDRGPKELWTEVHNIV